MAADPLPACVFALMQCPRCRVDYALCPDPSQPKQWLVFPAGRPAWPPLATMTGPFNCYQCNHSLSLIEAAVVLSADQNWIVLHPSAARVARCN